jgi:hypothetical protein
VEFDDDKCIQKKLERKIRTQMIDLTRMQVGWTRGTGGLSTEARGHAAMSAEISYVGRRTGVNFRIRRISVEIWFIS